ncbi:hypothetical protein ACYULU_07565 [Breznakiellaceae bacterium SP9]
MQAIRQIVDAERLTSFVDIPDDMRNTKVEIIILPFTQEVSKPQNPAINYDALEKLYGNLHEYADPAHIAHEKNAWQTAVIKNAEREKYEPKYDNS